VNGAIHTLTQRGTAIQELWGFGLDGNGQLGDNALIQRVRPTQVAMDVRVVAAGQYHSLIVKTDGSLWTMGDNEHGSSGTGRGPTVALQCKSSPVACRRLRRAVTTACS